MKFIIGIIVSMVAMLVGGCVSAYTKPKYPNKAENSRIELTFKVRKGVSYALEASGILSDQPYKDIGVSWVRNENWIPVVGYIKIYQKHNEIHRGDIPFLIHCAPSAPLELPYWHTYVFEAKVTGEVKIVITGNLSFLNKGREWRLCHTILK